MSIKITNELLDAYIDDHLDPTLTAQLEKLIRENPEIHERLSKIQQERDMGEHSPGATWRRERLSCPNREELSSYLLQALDADRLDYIQFHLNQVKCPTCLANIEDLKGNQHIGPKRETMSEFLRKSVRFLPQPDKR